MKKLILQLTALVLLFPILSFSEEYSFRVKVRNCFKSVSGDGASESIFNKVSCGILDRFKSHPSEMKIKIEDNLYCVNEKCHSHDANSQQGLRTHITTWDSSWEIVLCEAHDECGSRERRSKEGQLYKSRGKTYYQEGIYSRVWDLSGVSSVTTGSGIIFELEVKN